MCLCAGSIIIVHKHIGCSWKCDGMVRHSIFNTPIRRFLHICLYQVLDFLVFVFRFYQRNRVLNIHHLFLCINRIVFFHFLQEKKGGTYLHESTHLFFTQVLLILQNHISKTRMKIGIDPLVVM